MSQLRTVCSCSRRRSTRTSPGCTLSAPSHAPGSSCPLGTASSSSGPPAIGKSHSRTQCRSTRRPTRTSQPRNPWRLLPQSGRSSPPGTTSSCLETCRPSSSGTCRSGRAAPRLRPPRSTSPLGSLCRSCCPRDPDTCPPRTTRTCPALAWGCTCPARTPSRWPSRPSRRCPPRTSGSPPRSS